MMELNTDAVMRKLTARMTPSTYRHAHSETGNAVARSGNLPRSGAKLWRADPQRREEAQEKGKDFLQVQVRLWLVKLSLTFGQKRPDNHGRQETRSHKAERRIKIKKAIWIGLSMVRANFWAASSPCELRQFLSRVSLRQPQTCIRPRARS